MNWKFWELGAIEARAEQAENRAAYTDALIASVLASAQGNLTAQAERTAAVEFATGLIERCFAVSNVTPESLFRVTLTPLALSRMARQLILTGNSISAIDTSSGGLLLLPVANYDIAGGYRESSWRYRLELAGPSRLATRRLPSRAVVHVRMGSSVQEPWRGCSPLLNAGLTASMLGRLERRMAQEVNARVGHLLAIPDGTSEEQVTALRRDLAALEGNIALTETTSSGHGQGMRAAPQIDWQLRRFGAQVPESNIALRTDASMDVISALGIPPSLFRGTDGVSAREAYRLLLVSTLQPIADLIADELSRKLETTVTLGFKRLHAADIQARARAFGGMVAAGIDNETALELSGLDA